MSLFENAYSQVAALVRKFDEHKDQFLAPKYQEDSTRKDLLDDFWSALGWDAGHREQTNPREQEVKISKSDTAGSTRRVDYAFYLKPDYRNPVFFCEAKKPSRDLNNADDYFQLVRYGYGASTPVGALTNFDEFHIIDCRYQPHIDKSYPSAQIKVFGYKDYLDKEAFGFIYWIFSREAVEAGKLKEYAKSLPKQQGKGKAKLTAEEAKPVDEAFLTKLEEYRRILAKAFKKADENLNAEVLTEATQKVIDRLVFIRFLEDKYIESDYIVDQIAAKKGASWKSFLSWSKELDVKYNGVVFKPHDIDKPEWKAPDDKTFADLCADISHTHSKYLFTYIPIELLGSIYERFLGKVVTTTAKRADIEDKPEVRKAGGVYYTPKYIVDYIVQNTVGKILDPKNPLLFKEGAGGGRGGTAISSFSDATEPPPNPRLGKAGEQEGLTPKEISKLRFADIACGSGSFLIAVYDTVLHHVEKWYNDHPDDARKAKCTEIEKGIFALSLKQKQQILLDNIFGVDIDRQAVEVAQLSLFLKLLESESGATAEQLSFERTKILPDLSKNIQCGNSLVEYDISDLFPLTTEEEHRINPFSFQQAFKPIMDAGGFDAIVGNPPYVQIYSSINAGDLLPYFISHFTTTEYQPNTSGLFMERCVRLLNSKGRSGLIIPNYWLSTNYDAKLRAFVFKTNKTDLLVNTYNVFIDASVDTVLLFVRKAENGENRSFELRAVSRNLRNVDDRLKAIESGDWAFIGTQAVDLAYDIKPSFSKKITINAEARLEDYFYFRFGVKAYELGKGTPQQSKKIMEEKPYTAKTQVDKSFTKLLRASAVKHYELRQENDWIKYGENLAAPRDPEIFKGQRILIQRIVSGAKFDATYVKEPYICNTDVITLKPFEQTTEEMLLFYLGIINSSLCSFYIRSVNVNLDRATYPKINTDTLMSFRVPKFTESGSIPNLVNQQLATKKQLAASTRDSEKEQLQRKCDYIDGEIDRLVYELYGLTAEEIKIVEGS